MQLGPADAQAVARAQIEERARPRRPFGVAALAELRRIDERAAQAVRAASSSAAGTAAPG